MIPKMIHPLGKHWRQPKREDIAIDNTHALMSKDSFEQLHEYSMSVPTGVYEGKMWKAKYRSGWILRWFGNENADGLLPILNREIVVVEEVRGCE